MIPENQLNSLKNAAHNLGLKVNQYTDYLVVEGNAWKSSSIKYATHFQNLINKVVREKAAVLVKDIEKVRTAIKSETTKEVLDSLYKTHEALKDNLVKLRNLAPNVKFSIDF